LLDAGADPNWASEQKLERGEYKRSALSAALGSAETYPEDLRYSAIAELLRQRGGREEDISP
jgi:hypothetical protein